MLLVFPSSGLPLWDDFAAHISYKEIGNVLSAAKIYFHEVCTKIASDSLHMQGRP